MSAAAEEDNVGPFEAFGCRNVTEEIDDVDGGRLTFQRFGETVYLLAAHRIIRVARLQQEVTKLGHGVRFEKEQEDAESENKGKIAK